MNSPSRAQFRLASLLLWTGLSVPLGVGLAWASMQADQLGFAPLGLRSILVGLLLGAGMGWAAGVTNMAHRPSGLAAALAVAGLTAIAQHGIAYQQYRNAYQAAARSQAGFVLAGRLDPDFGPAGVVRFVRATARGGAGWLWLLDGALIAAACLAIVWYRLSRPFCNRCRSWYRTTRAGRLSADTAASLAVATGMEIPPGAQAIQYRFLTCRSGCPPTGLRLSWVGCPGGSGTSRTWLDRDQWSNVLALVRDDSSAPP